jgi:Ca-activated chloride channel family protein
MNRRSLLLWVAITAIFTAVVSAPAVNAQPGSPTSGSFRVVDESGKPAAACPLKHTAVKAEVSGFISRVTVTQNFENPFTDKIEAVYTFPLPEMAAVDDLTMQIGDRTIKGRIMRREDAAAAYDTAKQMGKVVSLLEQQRTNIFTQQVANILPGQQIRVTISYVETLKYEEGFYQWIFPMVVAPRYNTGGDSTLSPPRVPKGMRAGHDVSLEINLDAGFPITGITSTSHEIDVQQINEKRAVVRLKDNATIPNKDFLLTYSVGGDTMKDAVLAHHSDRGGFFTLILQPPQRIQAEDVMPKEMVFVLDTSGSMMGSPLDTAKKTMLLALDTLYPHDTFNLITFSGDTDILFPEPVPATPENLRKAKKFLSSRESDGGTELMKAVKAALDPSDSQYHVRLACFMTDGQVGNDSDIIAEVQKHRNARVFAMGFGDAPNRALLDKMTQYGRGEVDYVSLTSNSSNAARRFNDRIRNPLLTDVSIEWSDLSITDVYPRRIPDLFSAKPLILSGRYTTGGKGTIRLKGKMGGLDFVREIQVELPEVENDHDALGTLWARHKIDDLTNDEIEYNRIPTLSEEKRKEIAELGLTFKLMTPFTSFVAIEETLFTGSEEPRRVDVPVEAVEGRTSWRPRRTWRCCSPPRAGRYR